MKNLTELSQRIHVRNAKWWRDPATGHPQPQNPKVKLMLVLTELAEAVEGERKDLMDTHLKHRKMVEVEMADAAIRLLDFAAGFRYTVMTIDAQGSIQTLPSDNIEAIYEIALVVTRIGLPATGPGSSPLAAYMNEHYASSFNISLALSLIEQFCRRKKFNLEATIEEKLDYNDQRLDHTAEARMAPGGKKA